MKWKSVERKRLCVITTQCTGILLREVGRATHETQALASELSRVGRYGLDWRVYAYHDLLVEILK